MDVFAAVVVEPDGATHIVPVWAETRAQAGELACEQVGRGGGRTDPLGEDILVLVFAAGEIQDLHECAQDMVRLIRPAPKNPATTHREKERMDPGGLVHPGAEIGPKADTKVGSSDHANQEVGPITGREDVPDNDPDSDLNVEQTPATNGAQKDRTAAATDKFATARSGSQKGNTGGDSEQKSSEPKSAERKAPKRPTRPRKTVPRAPGEEPSQATLIPDVVLVAATLLDDSTSGGDSGHRRDQQGNLIPHVGRLDEMGFLELRLDPEDTAGSLGSEAPPRDSWNEILPDQESPDENTPDWFDPGVSNRWHDRDI